jgi:hypothetical protein
MSMSHLCKLLVAGAAALAVVGCATITGKGMHAQLVPVSYELDTKLHILKIDLRRVPQLQKPGGAVKFIDSRTRHRLIIARVSETEFAAGYLNCPYRSTELEYDQSRKTFACPSTVCKSVFKLNGEKLSGAAERTLPVYQTSVDGDILTVLLTN